MLPKSSEPDVKARDFQIVFAEQVGAFLSAFGKCK
jgi:hypothetical protein